MEPFSTAVGIIAVLGVAGCSCKHLLIFLRMQVDLPSEILHHCVSLETLQHTLENIKSLAMKHNFDNRQTARLLPNITRCLTDIREAESKVKKVNRSIAQGKLRCTLKRLQWSLSTRSWLEQFLRRVETWHVILSYELAVMNLYYNAHLLQALIYFAHDLNRDMTAEMKAEVRAIATSPLLVQTITSNPHQDSSATPTCLIEPTESIPSPETLDQQVKESSNVVTRYSPSFLEFLQSKEQTSISSIFKDLSSTRYALFILRRGRIIVRKWTPDGTATYEVAKPGFGVEVTFQAPWLSQSRILLRIFVVPDNTHIMSLSLKTTITFPTVVANDAETIAAARAGDIGSLTHLFASDKARPFDVLKNGNSLLHIAATHNQALVVKFLIEQGADPNASNNYGDTPLHLAIREAENYRLSRTLIRNGADIASINEEGQTPLHTFFNSAISRLLQYERDSIETQLKDDRGMTVIHYATWTNQSRISDVNPFVRGHNALLSDRDRVGRTMLHLAAQRGNVALVQMLLETMKESSSSPVRSTTMLDSDGRTPLHHATKSKRGAQVIDILRGDGVDLDKVDDCGRNALLHAAAEGKIEAFKHLLFLQGEQQLASLDNEGKDVFHLAYENGNTPVMRFLETTYGMRVNERAISIINGKNKAQAAFSWPTIPLVGLKFAGYPLLVHVFAVCLSYYGLRLTYRYLV